MEQIKDHYYRSHADLNPKRLVPVGPGVEDALEASHDRDELPGAPPAALR